MLVLQRKLGETIYCGEDIDPENPAQTAEVILTISRIVNSFDRPRVYAEVQYPLDGPDVESVIFTRDRPWVTLIDEPPPVLAVKLVSIDSLIRSPDSSGGGMSFDDKKQAVEFVCNLGFDAPKSMRIVRAEAIR